MKLVNVCLLIGALLLTGTGLNAEEEAHAQAPYQGSAEFEKMKTLAGTWTGEIDGKDGKMPVTVEYRVIAGGSAIEERCFAGSPMEMVTLYHDKEGQLSLTHYCMLHNQPVMEMTKSGADKISFSLSKEATIDVEKEHHMHSFDLTFKEDGTLLHECVLYKDGKPFENASFVLTRVDG